MAACGAGRGGTAGDLRRSPAHAQWLSAQRNKTDRNDARGIAQMMRVGLYRPVHVKTLPSQERRLLLTARKLLQAKLLDIEAVARKLAVVLHRMWVDSTEFRWGKEVAAAK